MAGAKMTGGWKAVTRSLTRLSSPALWKQAKRRAVLKEAHRLRTLMVEAFNKGGPPGKKWKALSTFTQLVNRALGKGDRRPLMDTGDLRNSHSVVEKDDEVFVGIHRTARGKRSKKGMANLGMIHENGAGPFTIRVTRKMRFWWLSVLVQKTGGQIRPLKQSTSVLIVRIPPRPWVGPIWDAEQDNSARNISRDTISNLGVPGLAAVLR